MNPSGTKFLRIRIDERTGQGQCQVVDALPAERDFHDCEPMVANLWANYTREVTARFGRTFSPAVLGGCALPREVIEQHLLAEVYRPRAFPALLADLLAASFTGVKGMLLAIPPTAGDPRRLAALVEIRLQSRSGRIGGSRESISRTMAWAAFAIGATTASLGVLRLKLFGKTNDRFQTVLTENLFVVFHGEGAHTRHVWREIDKTRPDSIPPLVLVLGHTPLEKRLRLRVEAKGGRVIHLMSASDLGASVAALSRCWREIVRLHRRGEQDLGMKLGPSFHVRAGAWFLRGLMHERFLRGAALANPEKTVAVFGLIAHVDSRLADFALRLRGAKTIHWLHGVVEDGLHYRANSSICLCQNVVDEQLRLRHGDYGRCRVYPESSAEILPMEAAFSSDEKQSGGLVITNLIHPDNRFAQYGAAATLAELLRMTAECFRSMQIPNFTWRPHPKESLAADFKSFKRLATKLGFQVNNSTRLADQVKNHSHVVSTFSGSIGDVADAGALPAIYAGLPYETEGHWGRLPEALKFHSAVELAAVFERLRDGKWVASHRSALLRQYSQPQTKSASAGPLLEELRTWI